jgi:hypothetical protein
MSKPFTCTRKCDLTFKTNSLHNLDNVRKTQAAFLLVNTCTVAAICCKILSFENRWLQVPFEFRTPLQRPKLHFFLSSPARLLQSVAKSEALQLELKGLTNKWQHPRH